MINISYETFRSHWNNNNYIRSCRGCFLYNCRNHQYFQEMKKYKILIEYRHGKDEKDFDEIEIEAESDEKAIELAKEHRRWIYRATIISE